MENEFEAYVPPFLVWQSQPEQQQFQGDDDVVDLTGDDAGDADDADDDDQDDDEDDEGGEGGGAAAGGLDVAAIALAVSSTVLADVEKYVDRRINSLVQKQRRQPPGAGQGQKPPAGAPRPDVREARSAYREYVADQIQFISPEERGLASRLATAEIADRARAGFDDADTVGREVAAKVAGDVKAMRDHYSARTRRALVRQGLLPDPQAGQGDGGGSGGDKKGDVLEQFKAGQAKAAELHPSKK